MKKKRYLKEGLNAGLIKEDLEMIKIVEDYEWSEFGELCSQFGLPDDDSVIKEIVYTEDD